MARIFLALAAFAVMLLATNIVLGLRIGDYNGLAGQYWSVQRQLHQLKQSRRTAQQRVRKQEEQFRRLGRQVQQLQQRSVLHFLFGLAASLVTVLINSITITYFIGTSRWCKEVVETYQLEAALAHRSASLKRKSFPWALGGILVILIIIALGGASLPFGANAGNSAQWVTPHWCAALVGTLLIGCSFLVQVSNIRANYEVIQQILGQVCRIRKEQGLDQDEPK